MGEADKVRARWVHLERDQPGEERRPEPIPYAETRRRGDVAARGCLPFGQSWLAALLAVGFLTCPEAATPGVAQQATTEQAQQATTDSGASGQDIAAILQRQQQMIEEQAQKLEEQAKILAQQEKTLRQQQQQLEQLQRQATASYPILPASMAMPNLGNQGTPYYAIQDVIPVPPTTDQGQPQPVPPSTSPAPPAGGAEEERPKSEKPPEQLLLERGGVLLPEGALQLEPSIEYDHFSSNQIAISGFSIFDAIIIGTLDVNDLKRDIVTARATGRYGLTDRIQLDTQVPFIYRKDSEIFGFGTANQQKYYADNYWFGDIQSDISYQPIIGDGGAIPDVIVKAGARFPTGESAFDIDTKSIGTGRSVLKEPPTGSGFYGVIGGFTLVWRVDPVVFFTGFNYTNNIPEDQGSRFGYIDPGDVYEYFGGINIALSESVSMNLSFDDQITSATTQNGNKIDGSDINDARLILGTSVGIGPRTSLTFNASAGLTQQSPDFAFTISLPMTFSLF
jgi:hypothetical protein